MNTMMTSHEELFVANGDFVDAKTTQKKFRMGAGIVLVFSLVMISAAIAMKDPWVKRSLLFNRPSSERGLQQVAEWLH